MLQVLKIKYHHLSFSQKIVILPNGDDVTDMVTGLNFQTIQVQQAKLYDTSTFEVIQYTEFMPFPYIIASFRYFLNTQISTNRGRFLHS